MSDPARQKKEWRGGGFLLKPWPRCHLISPLSQASRLDNLLSFFQPPRSKQVTEGLLEIPTGLPRATSPSNRRVTRIRKHDLFDRCNSHFTQLAVFQSFTIRKHDLLDRCSLDLLSFNIYKFQTCSFDRCVHSTSRFFHHFTGGKLPSSIHTDLLLCQPM